MSLEDFKNQLPIDDAKYNSLISKDGLNGYKLMNGFSGNVYLAHGDKNILNLNGDVKSEIMPELNAKKGGKKSRRNKKNKKSRRNRKTSRR